MIQTVSAFLLLTLLACGVFLDLWLAELTIVLLALLLGGIYVLLRRAEEKTRLAYLRESAINEILMLPLVDLPINCLVGRALESVMSVQEFVRVTQGAGFLVDETPNILVLKEHRNLAVPLLSACARVPFGTCLCGRAAVSGRVEFADFCDERHGTLCPGIKSHGRYSVPMRIGDRTIGVLTFYAESGHKRSLRVEQFLSGVASVLAGVISRKQLEETRAKLQSQLTQAQKMESVGRLAGGVAHDFNNMLGVILGNAEMALEYVNPGTRLHEDLTEIKKAAERSAGLTRQLLAFARRQAVAPKVLDLNETVDGMLKMLKRLIGEDVDLLWQPQPGLWPVRMDPSQLDQILANLCINARDAISGFGKLIIETDNRVVDAAYCAAHPECTPGNYVLLAVSDDGCGMDNETKAHLFEPFFTTKGENAGTGLGLATVYGIVRQNNGFIQVSSEAGQGTAFRIYLPRYTDKVGQTRM